MFILPKIQSKDNSSVFKVKNEEIIQDNRTFFEL